MADVIVLCVEQVPDVIVTSGRWNSHKGVSLMALLSGSTMSTLLPPVIIQYLCLCVYCTLVKHLVMID